MATVELSNILQRIFAVSLDAADPLAVNVARALAPPAVPHREQPYYARVCKELISTVPKLFCVDMLPSLSVSLSARSHSGMCTTSLVQRVEEEGSLCLLRIPYLLLAPTLLLVHGNGNGQNRRTHARCPLDCLPGLFDVPSAVLSGPAVWSVHGPYPKWPAIISFSSRPQALGVA